MRWRILRRYPAYRISDTGIVQRRLPGRNTWPGRVLKPCNNSRDYLYLSFSGARELIHILVCEAFHGPRPSKKHEAAHRDGRSLRNLASNLRWLTIRQNADEKIRHGRYRGEVAHNAKLTDAKVRAIRRLARKMSGVALAAKFAVTPQNISLVLTRRRWQHVT